MSTFLTSAYRNSRGGPENNRFPRGVFIEVRFEDESSGDCVAFPARKAKDAVPHPPACDFIHGADCVDEDIFARGLCLPSDIKMTAEQQDEVIAVIKSLF